MDLLQWLQNWYKGNCDGDWEHQYEIKIFSLDNPGWGVEISIADTELEEKVFEKIGYDKGDDWLFCKVENNVFSGVGDENKLVTILQIFRDFAER